MFDIGFFELLLIGIVGLLVIGPERLPGVASKVGRWVGRMRHFINNVKQDIDKEIRAEELKRAIENNADLDEIKRIIQTDKFTIEDEDSKDYVVKASDEDKQKTIAQDYIDDESDLDYGLSDHSDYGADVKEEAIQHENSDLARDAVGTQQDQKIRQREEPKANDANKPQS